MARRPSFNQRDATRLARAAMAAGLVVHRMETKNGRVIIVTNGETSTTPIDEFDELDRELAEFEARRGKD
jgi:coenzyme F420-reducing hydrogenase beta subunit